MALPGQRRGTVWAFPVDDLGHVERRRPCRADARAPKQASEIPTGLALSADGQRLYVVGNLGNRLHELDSASGKTLRSWDTGVAPQDVVLVGDTAYVSNRGGRRPGEGDLTAPQARAPGCAWTRCGTSPMKVLSR